MPRHSSHLDNSARPPLPERTVALSHATLAVRDHDGIYRPATDEQVISAANVVIDRKLTRGAALTSPRDARQFLTVKLGTKEHEVFAVLWLDSQHRLIEFVELSHGTIDGAVVYPRVVVKDALRVNAGACILVHNHPSGLAEPSAADRLLTDRLKQALATVDIRVLDHLVIAGHNAESFAERGWI